MDRQSFIHVAADTLALIDERLEALDSSFLDVELAGDVMTLQFSDDAKFVVNWHSAARQIWLAAGTHAWHFDYQAQSENWVAQKTGDELLATIDPVVGEKLSALSKSV